jgi:hypothetical protein
MADTGGGANGVVFDEGITIGTNASITRRYTHIFCTGGKVGATAGWTTNNDTSTYKCPASQTAATLTIPLNLGRGWVIRGFKVIGQVESAGNNATIDADLRKTTGAAGDLTDASVGAITQHTYTADAIVVDEKIFSTWEAVSTSTTNYVKLTATTAANTDFDIQGVEVYMERV